MFGKSGIAFFADSKFYAVKIVVKSFSVSYKLGIAPENVMKYNTSLHFSDKMPCMKVEAA